VKIRSLLALAAFAAASTTLLGSTSASAWECPANLTRPYYVTDPTGGTHRVCVPDLNCETCFGVAL